MLRNNCATTTIQAIRVDFSSANKSANDTLYLLKHAISPRDVKTILEMDYNINKGNGLVANIII